MDGTVQPAGECALFRAPIAFIFLASETLNVSYRALSRQINKMSLIVAAIYLDKTGSGPGTLLLKFTR